MNMNNQLDLYSHTCSDSDIIILLITTEEHYGVTLSNANILCDNKGTIHTFSRQYDRVPGSTKNNDILRVLRKIQSVSALAHKLSHVKAHQDDVSGYDCLSLEADGRLSKGPSVSCGEGECTTILCRGAAPTSRHIRLCCLGTATGREECMLDCYCYLLLQLIMLRIDITKGL